MFTANDCWWICDWFSFSLKWWLCTRAGHHYEWIIFQQPIMLVWHACVCIGRFWHWACFLYIRWCCSLSLFLNNSYFIFFSLQSIFACSVKQKRRKADDETNKRKVFGKLGLLWSRRGILVYSRRVAGLKLILGAAWCLSTSCSSLNICEAGNWKPIHSSHLRVMQSQLDLP